MRPVTPGIRGHSQRGAVTARPQPCEPRRSGHRRRSRLAPVPGSGASAAGRISSPSQHRPGRVILLTRSGSAATAPAAASAGPERFLSDGMRVVCRVTHAPAVVTPLRAGQRGAGAGHTRFTAAARAELPAEGGFAARAGSQTFGTEGSALSTACCPHPGAGHGVAAQVLVRLPWLPAPHRGSLSPHSGLPVPPPRGAGAGGRALRGSAVLTCGRARCSAPLPPDPPQDGIPSPWCIPPLPASLRLFPLVQPRLPAGSGRANRWGAGAGVRVFLPRAAESRDQAGQSAPDRFRSGSQPRPPEIRFVGFLIFQFFFPPKLSTGAGRERDGMGLS